VSEIKGLKSALLFAQMEKQPVFAIHICSL